MKTPRKLFLSALLFVPALLAQAAQGQSINLIIPEKTCFQHLIDKLSGWSPYCYPDCIDLKFLGLPELNAKDKVLLQDYAKARKPLGWEEELTLFQWADQGFPLQGKPEAYGQLKKVINAFYQRSEWAVPLAKRTAALKQIEPKIKEQLQQIDGRMAALRPVTEAFQTQDTKPWHTFPVYVLYTLDEHNSQGGANGPCIYAEVDPASSADKIKRHGLTLFHEALHLSLKPREGFKAHLTCKPNPAGQAKDAHLEQCAPGENGGNEYETLDEVLVHALANVIVGGDNPNQKYENYKRLKDKTLQRTWDGVRLMLPTIRKQLEKPQSKDAFLAEMIEVFLSQVHFKVWKAPVG